MVKMNVKDKPTLFLGVLLCLITIAATFLFFHQVETRIMGKVEIRALELNKAKRLIIKKDEIAAAYQRLRAREVGSMGDWVKELTELSKKEGFVFDSMVPTPSGDNSGNLEAVLKFRTNLKGFSGFISNLVMEDYLTVAENFTMEKIDGGLLDCEVTLRRVLT